jgi:hypothetical protein
VQDGFHFWVKAVGAEAGEASKVQVSELLAGLRRAGVDEQKDEVQFQWGQGKEKKEGGKYDDQVEIRVRPGAKGEGGADEERRLILLGNLLRFQRQDKQAKEWEMRGLQAPPDREEDEVALEFTTLARKQGEENEWKRAPQASTRAVTRALVVEKLGGRKGQANTMHEGAEAYVQVRYVPARKAGEARKLMGKYPLPPAKWCHLKPGEECSMVIAPGRPWVEPEEGEAAEDHSQWLKAMLRGEARKQGASAQKKAGRLPSGIKRRF